MLSGELGNHPWYVFKGHPVPRISDNPDSLVHIETVPIPKVMHDVFKSMSQKHGEKKVSSSAQRS